MAGEGKARDGYPAEGQAAAEKDVLAEGDVQAAGLRAGS